MIYTFPKNFLWGSSISAYQAEGGVLADGKKLSVADISTRKEGYCDNSVTSDFYHNYQQDIQLLAQMGAKAFRFSLAWPRIFPDGIGEVNQAGVQFYHNVLDELDKYHIEPIVTLFHYDLPLSLHQRYGGWKNRQTINAYAAFVKFCFQEYGNRIHKFLTINEPDILFMYGGHGLDLNGKEEFKKDKLIINHHFAIAHAKALELCHTMLPDAKIGPVFGYVPVYPKTCDPRDVLAAQSASTVQNSFFQELFLNGVYLDEVLTLYKHECHMPIIQEGDMELLQKNKSDMIALNYYKSDTASYCEASDDVVTLYPKYPGVYQLCENPYLERTKWGWEIDAKGIRYMLKEIYQRYHLPIIITENGFANEEHSNGEMIQDEDRIQYLCQHVKQCQLAIAEGVDLFGYCNWSFIDLLSTGHGFEKRYGLVYVQRNNENDLDLKRIPKQSYYWYKNVIQKNGIEE